MNRNDITLAYGMTANAAKRVAAANNDNDDTCVYAVVRRPDGRYVIGVCEAADGFFLGWL